MYILIFAFSTRMVCVLELEPVLARRTGACQEPTACFHRLENPLFRIGNAWNGSRMDKSREPTRNSVGGKGVLESPLEVCWDSLVENHWSKWCLSNKHIGNISNFCYFCSLNIVHGDMGCIQSNYHSIISFGSVWFFGKGSINHLSGLDWKWILGHASGYLCLGIH